MKKYPKLTITFIGIFMGVGALAAQEKPELGTQPLGQDKRLMGTVTGMLAKGRESQLVVTDRKSIANAFLVSPDTQIKRQIDLAEIKSDEFVAVIFEEEGDKRIVLSASVGAAEQVEKEKEELLKYAPRPEIPEAPEVPEVPEMPPMPEGQPEGGAPPPGGAPPEGGGQAGGKDKEASGFSGEDAEKAKGDQEGPLDDILSQKGPLSKGAAKPPGFVSGKVVSVDGKGESPVMVVKDQEGQDVSLLMGPHLIIINRYLDPSGILKGDKVEVLFEEKENAKLAKSILIARRAPSKWEKTSPLSASQSPRVKKKEKLKEDAAKPIARLADEARAVPVGKSSGKKPAETLPQAVKTSPETPAPSSGRKE